MTRSDHANEVIRRNNSAARCQPERIFFAGLEDQGFEALALSFPRRKTIRIAAGASLDDFPAKPREPIRWGADRIGIGLLKALQEGRGIIFDDQPSPEVTLRSDTGHVVLCEAGEDLTEVIAANYAFALGASLHIIPAIPKETAEGIMERFYSLNDPGERSPTQKLEDLKADLRTLCPGFTPPEQGSVTFISRILPFGFAFPEVPSTHLFTYPDLGACIIHGFAAEAEGKAIDAANLVDPGEVSADEVQEIIKLLRPRGVFIRGYKKGGANVRDVNEMVEHYPYDLLLFATHCGDVSGSRWTYEYTDSEGKDRRLVVDVGISVGREGKDGLLRVGQFSRFHSLDGVRWMDPERWADFDVGTAIVDWVARTKDKKELEPVHKEPIDRVRGSAALKMADHNYIPMHYTLACGGTPIVVNNACVSWHELAGRYVYGGARAYLGCLVEVMGAEAFAVTSGVFGKQAAKFLPHALWSTQNHAFGDSVRRPYVITGVYTQRLHWRRANVPIELLRKMTPAYEDFLAKQKAETDEKQKNRLEEVTDFFKRELAHFVKLVGSR